MIEIVRIYTVEAPPDRVWQLLMDTTALSSCIPGCETLDQDPETERRYLTQAGGEARCGDGHATTAACSSSILCR